MTYQGDIFGDCGSEVEVSGRMHTAGRSPASLHFYKQAKAWGHPVPSLLVAGLRRMSFIEGNEMRTCEQCAQYEPQNCAAKQRMTTYCFAVIIPGTDLTVGRMRDMWAVWEVRDLSGRFILRETTKGKAIEKARSIKKAEGE